MRRFKLAILFLALLACLTITLASQPVSPTEKVTESAVEAPSGFDDKTNGFMTQQEFNEAMGVFNRHYFERDGLGPVFNAETCLRCHQFPTIGGFSLNTVTKAGKFDGNTFTPHPGGLVIQATAIRPEVQETLMPGYSIVSTRISNSMLGDGFVEVIADETLRRIAREQPTKSNGKISGEAVEVPVLESRGTKRVGRFGWKSSQASLVSFVGEAFFNEIGLTSPLFAKEITSGGRLLHTFDKTEEPEIDMNRIELVARFIRSTKAPARDHTLAQTPDAKAGERLFESIGCAICHVPTIKTMPAGMKTNGNRFIVPESLGNKLIHPFSDFLLHDIGTGDGIVESGTISTRDKLRTAPLWGLGARIKRLGDHLVLMHNGASNSLEEAINRHAGEAMSVTQNFRKLSEVEKRQIIRFLHSL